MLRLARDRFGAAAATHARHQNFPASPNSTRPGEFRRENSEAKRDDNDGRPRQDRHGEANEEDAAAENADEEFAEAWTRFEPKSSDPLLEPSVHPKLFGQDAMQRNFPVE
jgi:hypothetical protein